ncbi:MAG: glutamine--tRNA ligase/YqeY domain fusion protein [Proteobacteria bacterium]|nr:glutamine--tRNA ligase/YqeY domain fusion protein [Pseudomonadota bacterium]MBU1739612.1 glutamine--tRNA ligase/YqeY domain fusion protein [Pseudomonadota bacterium]
MTSEAKPRDFIRAIIEQDIATGKHTRIVTRFPPEPNGYLHIGHAKSICLNFGISTEFADSRCHLRFDDTNPSKEEQEYVDSIKDNVRWLGFDWGEHLYFASDYFDELYAFAEHLIQEGKAYVCDLTPEEIREYRGTLTEPGRNSPYRERSPEENLDLFRKMRAGEFPDGSRVLRAKIDMTSGNINMRDPVLYRILRATHHRTGDKWCIYPMYDYTHPISDALEHITHSLCTLEFEDHRPLYDWTCDNTPVPCHPRQIEFARLNLNYTVVSKRKLLKLVQGGHVSGWDDPRMPTLSGIRRRGYTPASIRSFCDKIGLAKGDSVVDMAILEHCIREDLNDKAPRVMGVLEPLKVVITNYPEDQVEEMEAQNHPQNPEMGNRKVPFCREIYIEKSDFMEEAPAKFHRLAPDREVRLRYAYVVQLEKVVKDSNGNLTAIHCTYDPETRGGNTPDGRKIKGTIHWVSARHAVDAEVRLYDRLFTEEAPESKDRDFLDVLNPDSLKVLSGCKLEPFLKGAAADVNYQFERTGYFCLDGKDATPDHLVFNRTVTLRDSWEKMKEKA